MTKTFVTLCARFGTLLLTLALLEPLPASAQTATWAPTGPDGGGIQSLAIDPVTPTTIYAGAGSGGVFKSTDAGVTWRALDTAGLITTYDSYTPVAIDPSDRSRLYVGTLHGVIRSTDAGATWTDDALDVSVSKIAIDPQTPTTLYAGSPTAGVFRSLDRGVTWEPFNDGLNPTPFRLAAVAGLAIDPVAPTTLYLGLGVGNGFILGFYKRTDGGPWQKSENGIIGPFGNQPEIRAVVMDPSTPSTLYVGTSQGIFKTVDGAASWRPISPDFQRYLVPFVAIDPATPSTLYARVFTQGLMKSLDGGDTWQTIAAGSTGIAQPNALAFDPEMPTRIYAATSEGVFFSDDAGESWRKSGAGITTLAAPAIAIDPQVPATVYAGTATGVFRSVDGAATWEKASAGIDSLVNAIVIDPSTTETIYAGGAAGVFKSTDSGENWNPINAGRTTGEVNALAIDPTVPAYIYAGGRGGVFASGDAGANWRAINNGFTVGEFTPTALALAIDPAAPTTLYAGTDGGGLYVTVSGGAWWQQKEFINDGGRSWREEVVAVAIDPRTGSIYVAVNAYRYAPTPENPDGFAFLNGIYRSDDGGDEWLSISDGLPIINGRPSRVESLVIDPLATSTLYAGTLNGVYTSVDGGGTWHPITEGLNGGIASLAIDPLTPTTVYAGTSSNGVFVLHDAAGGSRQHLPFGAEPVRMPGRIEAERYDRGGQGMAYSDTTPGNEQGFFVYRTDDVDIKRSQEGGEAIGWLAAGEWLAYTIDIPVDGFYAIRARVGSALPSRTFHVEADGVDVTGPIAVPQLSDWDQYETVSVERVSLSAGVHVLRVVMGPEHFMDFQWLSIEPATEDGTGPFGGTPHPIPGHVEAEDYDLGGQGVGYFDTTGGNEQGAFFYRSDDVDIKMSQAGGYAIGWLAAGEWLAYTVDVASDGPYTIRARVGSALAGRTFHIEMDGTDVTGPVAVPQLADWDRYRTVSIPGVPLHTGVQVLRVVMGPEGFMDFQGFTVEPQTRYGRKHAGGCLQEQGRRRTAGCQGTTALPRR